MSNVNLKYWDIGRRHQPEVCLVKLLVSCHPFFLAFLHFRARSRRVRPRVTRFLTD